MKLYYPYFLSFFVIFFSSFTMHGVIIPPNTSAPFPPQPTPSQPQVQSPVPPQFLIQPQQIQQQPTPSWYQQRQTMFHAPKAMIKGSIKITGDHGKLPEFRIYFDGKETLSNQEGLFSIPIEDGNCHEFTLLICKGLQQTFEKTNTIKNLVLYTYKGYKAYALRKIGTEWNIEEKDLGTKQNFIVQPKTIVAVIDPLLVDHIESWKVNLMGNYIQLPQIILKSKAKQEIKLASAKSLLYSLDLKTFHEPVREEKKQVDKCMCTLVQ